MQRMQAQMEEVLFQIMQSRGFGDTYVKRYRMVTRFHLQRRPLVIFISGSACTGVVTNPSASQLIDPASPLQSDPSAS